MGRRPTGRARRDFAARGGAPNQGRSHGDLEEGRIKNANGEPFKDRRSYYNKILKSKPFRLAGKDGLAREVIEFYADNPDREVRFVDDENFRKLVSVISNPVHLLLLWLAWDIGENINTLLQLCKKHFVRQQNPDTKEAEYLVNLPRELLKRSRQARGEPTLYTETVRYAEIVLSGLRDGDQVFSFEYRQALKVLKSAAQNSGARCMPHNDGISWKDLRSGMACHLLKEGWTTDEVNFRLGHKPSSREIDVYVSYLAINRRKPKKKVFDNDLARLKTELEEAKQREKLTGERVRRHEEENQAIKVQIRQGKREVAELRATMKRLYRHGPP